MSFVRCLLYGIFIICTTQALSAQIQSGLVTTASGVPLESVNVVAQPLDGQPFAFNISKDDGSYSLLLERELRYVVSVRYLGYTTITDTVALQQDRIYNYVLQESEESLEEVLIQARAPVVRKQDTTVYRTEYFKTGNERKARDILENIPGVEVDKAGNVTVNGEPVDRLLVDGKVFFSGDEKLGVNNVPSDAIDEIEVLENYNDNPFMKGLTDDQQLALNLKLKEKYRRFVFGDVTAGGGIPDQYQAQGNLFYYAPQTGINLISGVRNDGTRIFGYQDYLDFTDANSKLLTDTDQYRNIVSSAAAAYLQRENFERNTNTLGALNINQELGRAGRLRGFSVWAYDDARYRTQGEFLYTSLDNDESTTNMQEVGALMVLNHLEYRKRLGRKATWDINLDHSVFDSEVQTEFTSISDSNGSRFLIEDSQPNNQRWTVGTNLNYRPWTVHTFSIASVLTGIKNTDRIDSNFNHPVFNDLIDYQGNQDNVALRRTRYFKDLSSTNSLEYFYKRKHHRYSSGVTFELMNSDVFTQDDQVTQDGLVTVNPNLFNNLLDYQSQRTTGYLAYQYKDDLWEVRTRWNMQWARWETNTQILRTNEERRILLPDISMEYAWAGVGRFRASYKSRLTLPQGYQLADRLRLSSYNSVYGGSPSLPAFRSTDYSTSFSRLRRSQGYLFTMFASLSTNEAGYVNDTELIGIDRITRLLFLDRTTSRLSVRPSITILPSKWRITFAPTYSRNKTFTLINGTEFKLGSRNYSYSINARSLYRRAPNVALSFFQQLSKYDGIREGSFLNTNLAVTIIHDFNKSWDASLSLNQQWFLDQNTRDGNNFNNSEVVVNYTPQRSAWSFSVRAQNLLDNDFRRNSSLSDFIIGQTDTFVLPLRVLFNVTYQL